MRRLRFLRWLPALLVGFVVLVVATFASAPLVFTYHVTEGRLTLYSDRPFDAAKGAAILRDVEARLAASPIDDHKPHSIYVCNADWRRTLFFNRASGAAGVNYYPLTNNVFIRRSDIDADRVFGASGKIADPPRTFTYYAAHEITHSFTAERIGASRLWNAALPQWVREGYADYVGLQGRIDVDTLYRRWREGDPEQDWAHSGRYTHFHLMVAYLLTRKHWSIEQLLAAPPTPQSVEAMMNADFGSKN